MKRLSVIFFLAWVIMGPITESKASLFTMDSYNVNLHDSEPGVVFYWDEILTTPISRNFEEGDSISFDLFEIGSNESFGLDNFGTYDISVDFFFSLPNTSATAIGESSGLFILGSVTWDNPAVFNFSDDGQFSIALSNALFGIPGSAVVQATMTYDTAPTTSPVPEPASLILFGIGLMGVAVLKRKDKKHASL